MLYITSFLQLIAFANKSPVDGLDNLEATPSEVVCFAGTPRVCYKLVSHEALLQKR